MKYFLFVVILSCTGNAFSQIKQKQLVNKNSSTYDGEVITYEINYNIGGINFQVGEVTFTNTVETYKSKKIFHVKGDGFSYAKYNWLYKVKDLYESYIDTSTMLPIYFQRNVSEAGKNYIDKVDFNFKEKVAISNGKKIAITDVTQDVLSSIYFARNINYKELDFNTKIPLDLLLDNELHHLYIKYVGKEIVSFKNKKYTCIKIKPLLVNGSIFKGGEAMTVWVTDDNRHIPVLIEAEILVGKIKVFLKNGL
jgi:hypothetical protein